MKNLTNILRQQIWKQTDSDMLGLRYYDVTTYLAKNAINLVWDKIVRQVRRPIFLKIKEERE